MSDLQLESVPLQPSLDIPEDIPAFSSALDLSGELAPSPATQPLVEPLDTFLNRIDNWKFFPGPQIDLGVIKSLRVSHRQWQTTLDVGQGSRGTCWAFAGIAALEAAYARTGVHVDLSEQYLFHISKAHENQVVGGGIHSLIGFQGGADVVHHLSFWAVPLSQHVPYIDQTALQALANSIPGTGMALSGAGGGTREQADWFEFDLRNIPLMGRWFAQYRVKSYGYKSNFSNDDIRAVLAAGYDVVVDVKDKLNPVRDANGNVVRDANGNPVPGGHTLLIHGYNDLTQTFDIKNSQRLPGFATMQYANDPQFDIVYSGSMYYITEVHPVQTQWAAMWVGRWETDHDGWRGKLIIRRFCDIRSANELPGPDSRISLGTWYGEDGRVLDVVGHFVDGGRGIFCNIGTQPFELYLHTRDPYRAGGRCWWDNIPFSVVMSRGTAVGAGSGFDRTEAIGIWDLVHDGWRGQLRIGAGPWYVQAADARTRPAWIDPGAIAHQVDTHIDFGGDNRDQHFSLLVHTHEDGLLGGVTSWGGKYWPVEGRMAQNHYIISTDGGLYWYQHRGRSRLAAEWDGPKLVGSGWGNFLRVFGGGDGVIYAIREDGVLLWYFHDGRNQGQVQWQGPKEVGSGWQSFKHVFAGDGGVIYAVRTDGQLFWYRHLGRRDGSPRWEGPFKVGTSWDRFITITAGPDGCIYGALQDGTLLWYRHYGHDHGYPIWHGPLRVGSGWQYFDNIWAVGNGYVYGRTIANEGDLWLWRHHGFLTGAASWTSGIEVGNRWGGQRKVLTT